MNAWRLGTLFVFALLLGYASTIELSQEAMASLCGFRCNNPNPQCPQGQCCEESVLCPEDMIKKYLLTQEGPGCGNWCWTSQSCVYECNPT